jgi:hypothetical protein
MGRKSTETGPDVIRSIAFFLLLSWLLAAAAEPPQTVQVITGFSKPAKCIAPVHILKVDGREVAVQSMGFRITAGKHTMSGRTVVDDRFCQTLGPYRSHDDVAPLEAEFEPGKIYYIGFDHSSPFRADWKYVIWQTLEE